MKWKEQLGKYEFKKDWESAVKLIDEAIKEYPDDVDLYLTSSYLLMHILLDEHYNQVEHNYYAGLLKKYFLESYHKFCTNPEYLFYMGKIACMAEWYFDIELKEAEKMMKEAAMMVPGNLLYKWADFNDLDMRISSNREKMISYAKEVLSNSKIKDGLTQKGSLGEYLLRILQYWSEEKVVHP